MVGVDGYQQGHDLSVFSETSPPSAPGLNPEIGGPGLQFGAVARIVSSLTDIRRYERGNKEFGCFQGFDEPQQTTSSRQTKIESKDLSFELVGNVLYEDCSSGPRTDGDDR